MKKLLTILCSALFCSTAYAAPQNFSVNWNAIPGAVKYQLSTRVETATPIVTDVTTTTGQVTQEITTGQKFYAKVRACDAVWCGDYSTEVAFTMPGKPATPGIIAIQLVIMP